MKCLYSHFSSSYEGTLLAGGLCGNGTNVCTVWSKWEEIVDKKKTVDDPSHHGDTYK